MRSRLTVDSMYQVYTQEQSLQNMAEVAAQIWEEQVQSVEAPKREQKAAKMLNLATQAPHSQFGAFAQAIAESVDARNKRKKARSAPAVPVPAVIVRETEMQRLVRNLDLHGLVLGGLRESLDPESSVWLYAQTRLVERMKQAGLPQQCDALWASFAKEGWQTDVIKQCVAWLNVGALDGLLAQVFTELGAVWEQFAEDEQAGKPRPKLTVAQTTELQPIRVLLRVLGIAGLRELAMVSPDSPLEDALAMRLKTFASPLGAGIADHHAATQLHALFDAYQKEGEKAFAQVKLEGAQKQAARMYCRVVAFVQKQEQTWAAAAKQCMAAEAMARIDRKLAKQPGDTGYLVERARALSDHHNDHPSALAVLDSIPKADRNAGSARERAIVLGAMSRLSEMQETLDEALATPAWDDTVSLAKLFCLRAEARMRAQDALGAWSDARRATLIAPSLPRLSELNSRVLQLLEKDWEKNLSAGLQEAAKLQAFRLVLAQARSALLHERWEAAAKIAMDKRARSPEAAATAEQVATLAQEMPKFFAAAQPHLQQALPPGITSEMAEMLRQNGWDPQQDGLPTIAEETD